LPQCRNDLELNGVHISHLEHADDLLLISTTPEGLQMKMEHFYHWCRENFMVINALKSHVCLHGPRPRTLPSFAFAGRVITLETEYTYLGVMFCSDARNLFDNHYSTKASKTSAAAHSILHVDAMVDSLPPAAGKTLYTARLEPLLLYGCEAMPDTDDSLLERLTAVQTMFIRSLLGVHKRAVLAPLYTETGLIPLKYRRIELVLRYLQYAIECPAHTYVRAAIADSLTLAASGEKSWYMDLQLVISRLHGSFTLPVPGEVSLQALEQLRSKVDSHMRDEFKQELDDKKKLYLLRERKGPVLALRPYLGIRNGQHRESLTHLLLSTHTLAVERLRWVERYRLKVPFAERLCRFCLTAVETPEHALLEC
ncbi:hypothetical protein EXIGLDRAFT_595852, partial [Exidia glandulosa HHB12029]